MAKSQIVVEMSSQEAALFRGFQRVVDQQVKMETGLRKVGQEGEKAGQKLKKAGQDGQQSFGSQALSQLGSYVTGMLSLAAVAGTVQQAFRDMEAARKAAADAAIQSEKGLSKLLQLAGGDKSKLEAYKAAGKQTFAEGGAATLDQAYEVIYQLESAGALGERKLYSDLAGVIDPAMMAEGAGVMTAAMGREETGSHRELLSKAMEAAKPVTGAGAADLLKGAAEAAVQARALGMSDEELLAATSMISEKLGSAKRGGTALRTMLGKLVELGYADTMAGQGLPAMIREIRQQDLSEQELAQMLGGVEAWSAFGNLTEEGVRQRAGEIGRAAKEDAAGQMIDVRAGEEDIQIVKTQQKTAATEELSRERLGKLYLAADTARSGQALRMRERGTPEWLNWIGGAMAGIQRRVMGDEWQLRQAMDAGTLGDQEEGVRKLLAQEEESTLGWALRKGTQLASGSLLGMLLGGLEANVGMAKQLVMGSPESPMTVEAPSLQQSIDSLTEEIRGGRPVKSPTMVPANQDK